MLQRACRGVPRPYIAPRLVASVATASGSSSNSAEKPEHLEKPFMEELLPQTTSKQYDMWREFENGSDRRLENVKPNPYHSTTKRLTKHQTDRKAFYDRCKQIGDTTTAMRAYKKAITKVGSKGLKQEDHDAMMALCLKEGNLLMFLVFFAQTIGVGDGVNFAMAQVRNARKLVVAEGHEALAAKLSVYTWCVAMQKVQQTCDLTQLAPNASNTIAAERTLAHCVQGTRPDELIALVKQSPFQGLGFSLIEVFHDRPKIICGLLQAVGNNVKDMTVTTFGRVLVALTETGQYDTALKMYNDPKQTSLQCRTEYVDHVAIIYAALGEWEKFCKLITSKYARLDSNTDTKSLAAVLSRVREAGGGAALLHHVGQKAADLLPLKMVMCMAAGDWPAAVAVYQEGYKEGLAHSSRYGRKLSKKTADSETPEKPVDPLLTHLLLQAHDHNCEPQESMKLLLETPVADITPLMLSNAIQACVGAYSRADLIRLMQFVYGTEGLIQDVSVSNAIIRGLMRLGGWSEAITVFDRVGIKADIDTYYELLRGLVYHKKHSEFSFYLTKLQRTKEMQFTAEIYGTIMQNTVALGEIDKAEQLLVGLEKAAPKIGLASYHYQYLMNHYLRTGEHEKVTELYQRMSDRGIVPSGAVTRTMLTNIKRQYDYRNAKQRRTALVVMEAAALDIVASSDILGPGVISPFVREAFAYIGRPDNMQKNQAIEMMSSFLAKYTEKHGGGESMRVLMWVMELESLKPKPDFDVADSCWQRLLSIADMRNQRNDQVRGFRPTNTSQKHVQIMCDALEIYSKLLKKKGATDKLPEISEQFRERRWRVPYSITKEIKEE